MRSERIERTVPLLPKYSSTSSGVQLALSAGTLFDGFKKAFHLFTKLPSSGPDVRKYRFWVS